MNASEWTCSWYLRLNGYFVAPNFIVHGRPSARTDVDVLAVRFPYSEESNFKDDSELRLSHDRIDVVLAEAKSGPISSLNGPWSRPQKGALDYVLKRVGIAPKDDVSRLANDLYKHRSTTAEGFRVRILAFAESISDQLRDEGVIFIGWNQVLKFIHRRFRDNDQLKRDHVVWDKFGQYLWMQLSEGSVPPSRDFFSNWKD